MSAYEQSGKILIVEDDPGAARLEGRSLERAGFAVRVAATAEEAMAALKRGGIDLVVMDYLLPGGVTGLDLHARIREAGADIPIILVTGYSDGSTIVRALRAGVRDFVSKSAEYLEYLPEAARRVLRHVRLERQLAESQARLAGVIASAKDAIIATGPDHRIALFNRAAEQMFGCPAGDALGRPLRAFIWLEQPGELGEPDRGPGGVGEEGPAVES